MAKMKKVTYKTLEGKDKIVEYDSNCPCINCGFPVWEASMGGTVLCPWCDCGKSRTGGGTFVPRLKHEGHHPNYADYHSGKIIRCPDCTLLHSLYTCERCDGTGYIETQKEEHPK